MADEETRGPETSPRSCTSDSTDLRSLLSDLPTKADLAHLLSEIKTSVKQEVTALQAELSKLSDKITTLETAQAATDSKSISLSAKLDNQARQIYLLRRAAEDSENRNRRCNVRVRGISEEVDLPEARQLTEDLFRQLLGLDRDSMIRIERFHRVTTGRQGKPRDILCCMHHFTQKEEILRKAREAKVLKIADDKVELYQDWAYSTILQRRMLREEVEALKTRKIIYRWAFPFALAARYNGAWLQLREPSDAQRFCKALDITIPDLSEWSQYAYGYSSDPKTDG
ncbi:hypothetical protein XELAEV_18008776mg [Xenopus laevis]|uniref:Uncharacterized protein n=1 Tax=Xenopus laevis TaxID=8355 RepID=A0A974DSE2_XENLA|nr:hypothetical protein XELAEV_18008776mg [Xenopus laevis]